MRYNVFKMCCAKAFNLKRKIWQQTSSWQQQQQEKTAHSPIFSFSVFGKQLGDMSWAFNFHRAKWNKNISIECIACAHLCFDVNRMAYIIVMVE